MIEKTTVPIEPEAAVRALAAESEWRRNRILVLEQQIVVMERQLAEAKAAAKPEAKEE